MKIIYILLIGLFVVGITIGLINSNSEKEKVILQEKYPGNEYGVYYDLNNPNKIFIKKYDETEFKEAGIINDNQFEKPFVPIDYEVEPISKEQAYQYAKEEAEFYNEINYEGGKTYYIN